MGGCAVGDHSLALGSGASAHTTARINQRELYQQLPPGQHAGLTRVHKPKPLLKAFPNLWW
jgi:hypothetical protein